MEAVALRQQTILSSKASMVFKWKNVSGSPENFHQLGLNNFLGKSEGTNSNPHPWQAAHIYNQLQAQYICRKQSRTKSNLSLLP